jgi:AraC-like DNA-binding protein
MGLLIQESGLTELSNNRTISLAQEILIYLQDNYLKPVTLKDTALHFGYSKSRFSHIFNEYFDCTLVDYINGLRSRHALKLLQESDITVTEIGLSCGFDSTRTFYRAFSKTFSCTPGEYRKSGM